MRQRAIALCVRRLHEGEKEQLLHASYFEQAGFRVRYIEDTELLPVPGEVLWIQHNLAWFPHMQRRLLAAPRNERPFVVIWHTEPLPLPSRAGLPPQRLRLRELAKIILRDPRATDVYTNYRNLRRLNRAGVPDLLVVSTPSRAEFLSENGIAAEWVPLGYTEGFGRELGLERDIGVLFLGALDDPRHRWGIDRLRKSGVDVVAAGDWNDPAYWGENRSQLINRARVFLGIPRHPGKLAGYRMILGMANGALVVSEPLYDSRPFVSGTHFVTASIEQMPQTIAHYLEHERDRRRIAQQGQDFVMKSLTMRSSIDRILTLIDSHPARAGSAAATA